MKNFFTAEDFPHYMAQVKKEEIAALANEKLNKLIESWPVVYCSKPDKENSHLWSNRFQENYDTHKARLAFIEEIKKQPCTHPIIEHTQTKGMLVNKGRCGVCKVELVAEWKEKK